MPELAAMFLIGSFVTWFVAGVFAFLQLAKYQSLKYRVLQKNLAHLNLRWNDINGEPEVFSEGRDLKEFEKAKTTYVLLALTAGFMSWLGLFLMVVLWVSVKKLLRNRWEEVLFSGELARQELAKEQVHAHWLALPVDSSGLPYKI